MSASSPRNWETLSRREVADCHPWLRLWAEDVQLRPPANGLQHAEVDGRHVGAVTADRFKRRLHTGTILGALILTVLDSLLTILDVSQALKQMLYGIIILGLAWVYAHGWE